MTIKYRVAAQPENWICKVLSGGIQLNYIILTPVQKYPAGTHLNGHWSWAFSAKFASNTVTSPTFLNFKSAGTFSETKVTGIESASGVPEASVNSSSTSQAGDNLNIDGVVFTKGK
jgi:hypothetical protein